MKPNDIHRSVQAQRHGRTEGDAPAIGRVARMPGSGLLKNKRRSRKKHEDGDSRRLSPRQQKLVTFRLFLLSGTVVLLLSLAILSWLVSQLNSGESTSSPTQVQAPAATRPIPQFPTPSVTHALALVKQALAMRDPEKIAGSFRLGATTPAEAAAFLTGLAATDGTLGDCEWLGTLDANNLALEGVLIEFRRDHKPTYRLALLTPDPAGKWRVDFEALARTATPSWRDLLEKRAEAARVRVHATRDSYYNGPFHDDREWDCYRLACPDLDRDLIAYCRTGSPQAKAMRMISQKEEPLNRATLELRRVAGADSRQFEIARVLAEDWVTTEVPFDEAFK